MNNRIAIDTSEDAADSELVMHKQGSVGHVQSIELAPATTAKRLLQFTAVVAFVVVFFAHQRWLQIDSATVPDVVAAAAKIQRVEREVVSIAESTKLPSAIVESDKGVAKANDSLAISIAPTVDPLAITVSPEFNVAPDGILSAPSIVDTSEVVAAEAIVVEPHKAQTQLNELRQLKMDLLAKKAQIALQKDRLTTPTYDNAVNYYQKILAIDSDSLVARQGLLKVAQRYHEIAVGLQSRGETEEAASILVLARAVLPNEFSSLPPLPSPLNRPKSKLDGPGTVTSPALNKSSPAQSNARATSSEYVGQSSQSTRTEAKAMASHALLQGDVENARQLLRPFMSQRGEDGELVALMHQVHMAAGELTSARELRMQAQGIISTYLLARMQANELLVEGNPHQAVHILEANLPEFEQDPTYYGLLAGLYFKVGRFAEAQTAYQQLLAVDPDVGRYWLGYAVALDAQGKAKEAASAFSRARQMLPESDSAIAYIDQRVKALGAF